MGATEFKYVIYIASTPEIVWEALTEPVTIAEYFEDSGPKSTWEVGSKVEWKIDAEEQWKDWGQKVLKAEPGKVLSYTWHGYQEEMVKYFPHWTGDTLAALQEEPISKVTFTLEDADAVTQLTLLHDGFAPDSEMLAGTSDGWEYILSNLKTVVETGKGM